MSRDLQKDSLLIISDTPMWHNDNQVSVFEPTLREVEWLSGMFKQITWIGYGQQGIPKTFARTTEHGNINFVLLPYAVGGKSIIQKFKILPFLPQLFFIILKHLRKHTFVHTRGPSVPALIAILISYFDNSRTYWHKYAGNWIQNPAPWAYALQRFFLKHIQHKVSVNGNWPDSPPNFISLENPCLTNVELREANDFAKAKSTGIGFTICFVGALTRAKGIYQLIDALNLIKDKRRITNVLIAGDGPEREALEIKAKQLSVPVQFLGNIKRNAINEVYKNSDIIVLPSSTEGFPKVIAEAAAFGCVPLVTNISSIDQYIKNGEQGKIINDAEPTTIATAIEELLGNTVGLQKMKLKIIELSSRFTYERYCQRVEREIFENVR